MSKTNVKKIIISLIAILMVIFVAKSSLATDNSYNELDELIHGNANNNVFLNNPNVAEIDSGTRNNVLNNVLNDTNTINNTNESNNTNGNKPENLAGAGIENYSSFLFIAIFVISAVYAYKKVRDYNI